MHTYVLQNVLKHPINPENTIRGLVEYMYRGYAGIEESHIKGMITAGKALGITGLIHLFHLQGTTQTDPKVGVVPFQITEKGEKDGIN